MNLEGVPTTWSRTRTYYIQNHVWGVQQDFGNGNEDTFTCPTCNRTLPVHIVTLDHVISRAQMSQAIDAFVDQATVPPGGLDWSQHTIRGANSANIPGNNASEKKSFLARNCDFDLDNLVPMCSQCNTRKNST